MSVDKNAKVAKTAIVHDNVTIEKGANIHDYVVLYPGTIIKSCVEIYDHCTIGKLPTSPGSTSRSYDEEYGNTVIEHDSILCPGVVVYKGSVIGHNTLVGDNCSIRENCRIGDYDIVSRGVTVNYETVIGNHTKIMDNSHITGNMTIGDHVFISVCVSSTNDNTMGRQDNAVDMLAGPIVEDYATIGAGASLLPGVRIGTNAIVGAAALVTKDVLPEKVVMGVPAKVVRDVDNFKRTGLQVGMTASISKTVSDEDVLGFAEITGDRNPIHIDKKAAEKSVFKKRVVHGMFLGGLVSAVLGTKLPGEGTIYLEQNLRFNKPVFIGDTVTVKVVVAEIVNSEKNIYRLETDIANQSGECVSEGYAVVKYDGCDVRGGTDKIDLS